MRLLIATLTLLTALSCRAEETILDLRTGQPLTRDTLIAQIRDQDMLLLGEIHDNHRHHALRGLLLADLLSSAPYVVAEHLSYGKTYRQQGELPDDLAAAGFDARAWDWPTHLQLFEPIARHDIPLAGGNLPLETARRIVREGEAALPPDLATLLKQAPLAKAANDALDHDLLEGHCGHLKASMLPNMRLAQRARDAAMFAALSSAPAPRLKVLVAGNGHIRMDYGVPTIITKQLPEAKWMSIAFIEAHEGLETELPMLKQRYTHLWITETQARGDPCADFRTSR